MLDNGVHDFILNGTLQFRTVSHLLHARPWLERIAPGGLRICALRFRFAIDIPLDSPAVLVKLIGGVATTSANQAHAFRAGYFQAINVCIKSARIRYVCHVVHEVIVLALVGIATLKLGTVELERTAGQHEISRAVRTARRNHWNPWGQFVRVIANDPVNVRI